MSDLVTTFNLNAHAVGHLTSAVQFGFIIGTLVFAILTIADRFSPSKVFALSALLGALFNLAVIWEGNSLTSILMWRFCTGFFLAGIYPVGMKIAADYYAKGLGKSLGLLVGALVVGTAFPHLLKESTGLFSWKAVLIGVSVLAVLGGLLMLLFVPDGPYRKPGQRPDLSAFFKVFQHSTFRSAAFGYMGHMWELYAFWAFVPAMLHYYTTLHPETTFNIPLLSFLVIGLGGLACVVSSQLAYRLGNKQIAFAALLLSCICCMLSPWLFTISYSYVFIAFMLFWGIVVIADSPLFSTLVAQSAQAELKGTALTIVNSMGFAITIISIQLVTFLHETVGGTYLYTVLAVGPLLGLMALGRNKIRK